jgi:hypothetical protein
LIGYVRKDDLLRRHKPKFGIFDRTRFAFCADSDPRKGLRSGMTGIAVDLLHWINGTRSEQEKLLYDWRSSQ